MITIQQVRRLPACRTTVALYAKGEVDRDEFYDVVTSLLAQQGVPPSEFPDDATIYVEHWREVPWHGRTRLVRCKPDDDGAFAVTAVDLKTWSRGRMVK